MEKRKSVKFGLFVIAAIAVYFLITYIQAAIYVCSVPTGITVTPYNVSKSGFGAVACELSMDDGEASTSSGKLSFKLFGLLPLRTVDILCAKDKQVRLGGFPLGIVMNVDGVLVDEIGFVDTAAGRVSIDGNIKSGDIILNLNDTKIANAEDFASFMDFYDGGDKIKVTLNRNGRILCVGVYPLKDELSGKYKLGLWVKDTVSGVGTTSFVKSDNTFAALGHGIAVNDNVLPITGGNAYDCDIVGVNKGAKGVPGELKGVLKDLDKPIGSVYRNTQYGVYGKFDSETQLPEKYYHIGSRLNVRNGKAKIYTTVDGKADFYDIEIIRAMPQSERSDKSMVVRVTDKRLLELCGGIVRGMSGSPIIQNDMVVGALTHVFVNDPTKGYGLYLDWMY